MEDEKPEAWTKKDTIEHEIDVAKAVEEVADHPQFHKALFMKIFKQPIEDMQNGILMREKAYAKDTKLRWTYHLQTIFTVLFTVGLIGARATEIYISGFIPRTIFDLALSLQAILMLFSFYFFSRVSKQTYLRLSEERKKRLLAETLIVCHQAMIGVMDQAKFPVPDFKKDA